MKAAYPFAFGTMLITYEPEGDHFVLTGLRCTAAEEDARKNESSSGVTDLSDSHTPFSDLVFAQAQGFMAGERRGFDIPYRLEGTDFQIQVWHALLEIPYGETRTYGQIAEMIGNPKAVRAVGMANNKNPLLLIVPCHRVIGKDGSLTGYAGGLPMKEYLLRRESESEN